VSARVSTPSMPLSFSYEVSKFNSDHYAAMYPGPNVGPDGELLQPSLGARESDPGYLKDALWVCSLCHNPVLDDRGIQKYARAFVASGDAAHAKKQPDNWMHCEPCRRLSHKDKSSMALLASAEGTKPIDQVFVAASRW